MRAISEFLASTDYLQRWLIAIFFIATIVFYTLSTINRSKISAALKGLHRGKDELGMRDLSHGDAAKALRDKVVVAPERLWTYDGEYIERFVKEARHAALADGSTALSCYTGKVLRRWDVLFAISLALFTALFNFSASVAFIETPFVGRAMLVFAGMGLLYGVADLAENFKLATILEKATRLLEGDHVDSGEAAAANALTRIKIISLSSSITGVVLFSILYFISEGIRRSTPQPRPPVPTPA